MAKYFCPIELTRASVKAAGRFFFIEVDAVDAFDATVKGREHAIEMMGGTAGYARWAAVPDLPSFDQMQALSDGFRSCRYGRSAARQAYA